MENKKENTKKIKAVIFDIGGVLRISKNPVSAHEIIAKKLNVDLDSWIDSICDIVKKVSMGKISQEDFIKISSKRNNVPKSIIKPAFKEAYKNMRKRNDELFKIAKKIKEKGIIIGILSNQW